MGFLAVLVAAAAAWLVGAAWYMALARPWMQAARLSPGADGRPEGSTALPYLVSLAALAVVAGMMRHMLAMSGIATPGGGLVAGLGVGAFFIAPWIVINNAYTMRPWRLSAIDGGYAVLGAGAMGLVLGLF